VESEIHEIDNRGVRHAGIRDPAAALRLSAPKAARGIVRAAERRRRERIVTGHGKVIVFVQRHAPWLVRAGIRWFGVRGRNRMTS
jgi:hypothetical protein